MFIKNLFVSLISILMLSGCISAHKYSAVGVAQFGNKKLSDKTISVGKISLAGGKDGEVNNPQVRLGTMSSPYDGLYSEYLRRALIMELVESQIYSDKGDYIISGTLIKNEITSPVLERGRMTIAAKIVVSKGGGIVFDKVIERDELWDVPFAGDYARRKAPHVYLRAMNKFVEKVFDKIDFAL